MENGTQEKRKFILSIPPHIRHSDDVSKIMISVLLSLSPAAITALYFFGLRAFFHIIVTVFFSVAAEAVIQKIRKVPVTINDYSAALTGLLLAFNMPAGAPFWASAVGGVFAIGIVKQAFGGLGHNFINPALAARAFLLAAWPVHMTAQWTAPRGTNSLSGIVSSNIDGVASATPLAVLKKYVATGMLDHSYLKEALLPLFTGQVGGSLGETSALALLIGGGFLLYKRYIDFRIPLTFIGTVFILGWFFNGTGNFFSKEALVVPLFHILSGGVMLGAFFMATDMVTSPITPAGNILFGIGCGCITMLIRLIGGYPEGVSYSILIMNIAAPLLDRIKMPKKYGAKKDKNEE